MDEHRHNWVDHLLTARVALAIAIVLLLVIAAVATAVAIWHGQVLCQRFAESNTAHREYMEGEAREIATQVSTALHGLSEQTETLSELVTEMRVENKAREAKIIESSDAIYVEAREFRKAALMLYRELEAAPWKTPAMP